MRPLLACSALALVVSAAFLGGRLTAQPHSPASPMRPAGERAPALQIVASASAPPSVDSVALREELRAMIREELNAKAIPPKLEDPPAPEDRAGELSVPNHEAHANAERLLHTAAAARNWSDKDAAELHGLMPQMAPAQRDQISSDLFSAINRREIKLAVSGLLF